MTGKILWKIYVVWFLRRILPLMLGQLIILVVVLKLLAGKIFLGRILENAASVSNSDYWEFFQYLAGSFFQANLIVQIFVLSAFGFGALLLRDFGRALVNYLKTLRNN